MIGGEVDLSSKEVRAETLASMNQGPAYASETRVTTFYRIE